MKIKFNHMSRWAAAPASLLALTVVAGCGDPGQAGGPAGDESSAGASAEPAARETTEASGAAPRLAVTYDGGVMVLDSESLEVLDTFPAEGFNRLNPAGDNRHLFLTEGDSFRLLDLGTWSEPHGDHAHAYTTDPLLTEQRITGSHPGHLVNHDGRSLAFFDGTGEMHLFDPANLSADSPIDTTVTTTDEAHHGVAVPRADDSTVVTIGDEESRSGVKIVDEAGETVAENTDCPGVHGEAVAEGGVITVGCEDGLIIIDGEEIRKVDSPDDYGRIGNQFGSEHSPVVLGDYKVDEDAELERPTRVTLTDTRSGELRLVDLPASYSFRSLARGPQGEALVLGTDGKLRVIDPASAEVTREIEVAEPWEEPVEWQEPRPTVHVAGDEVLVTEPGTQTLHVVDIGAGEVTRSSELPEVPNEVGSASGKAPAADHAHDHGDHEGHDHGDEGHGHEGHDHGHEHSEDDHDHGDHEGHDH